MDIESGRRSHRQKNGPFVIAPPLTRGQKVMISAYPCVCMYVYTCRETRVVKVCDRMLQLRPVRGPAVVVRVPTRTQTTLEDDDDNEKERTKMVGRDFSAFSISTHNTTIPFAPACLPAQCNVRTRACIACVCV